MGSADSIEPILLQPRNPISPELIRDSNPDSGVVQMHIRAAQLDSHTIEQQPLSGENSSVRTPNRLVTTSDSSSS